MPSETLPIRIRCTRCNDNGDSECPECSGSGQMKITDCPDKLITTDVWETIELAGLYEKGLPPVMGGALDQTQNFISAAGFIFAEKAYWKKVLGVFD